jgi:hypothetical protein
MARRINGNDFDFYHEKPLKNLQQRIIPPRHQQILYNQIIDEQQPGTILRDFGVLLDFVREHAPLNVTSMNHLILMKLLPQLNAVMSHPIKLDLKRPQHKSYPNILGLYLLLRTTGLASVEGSGAKQRLVIDEEILSSWNSLNPTERYFMLLETALLRAEPAIIGDYGGGIFNNPLYKWADFLKGIPQEGLDIAGDPHTEDAIISFPGLYNLTLMQMFEVVTIRDDEPLLGKGWRIIRIHKTPLGDAVFQELADSILSLQDDFWAIDERRKEAAFGELQPIFQPFFPEWQHNLVIPEHEIQEGTYIFKVTVWKNVWRRIAIPGRMVLDRLSDVILDAFEFDDRYHLYRFIYTNRFGLEKHIDHPELHEGIRSDYPIPFTDKITVQEVPLRPGKSMIFFFDFGDQWEFEVLLEKIDPDDPTFNMPKILEKHGKAPEQYGYYED